MVQMGGREETTYRHTTLPEQLSRRQAQDWRGHSEAVYVDEDLGKGAFWRHRRNRDGISCCKPVCRRNIYGTPFHNHHRPAHWWRSISFARSLLHLTFSYVSYDVLFLRFYMSDIVFSIESPWSIFLIVHGVLRLSWTRSSDDLACQPLTTNLLSPICKLWSRR